MDATTDAVEAAPEEVVPRWKSRRARQNGAPPGGGAVYGLGMIGAMVYFFQKAESNRDFVLAIPKASVWPALLVYKLLKSFYG
jgi:hypothetical protein